MKKQTLLLLALVTLPVLTQCNTLEKDIAAIKARNAVIAQEQVGNYYIGRRYHVPSTRFWGYLREPGQSWRTAKLVVMDEKKCLTPDRSPETGKNAKYRYDNNYEYQIFGKYTGEMAYEPNSNLKLPIFRPSSFREINKNPGWLFKPSEKRKDDFVS
ncbi:MAG: hypothetical protein RR889_07685, partial [Akkermansia sp.]